MAQKTRIVGREEERELLEEAFKSKRSEFIALYGRRRVGKTYLIKNFFDPLDCYFVYVSGLKDGHLSEQLRNFTSALEEDLLKGIPLQAPISWMDAFKMFNQLTEKLDSRKKLILFLDEIPWLATKRSRFLQALEYYWNRYWSHNPRLKLVICGSAASWLIRNIIMNKGGLYNRVTRQIRLDSFTLKETSDFLKFNGIRLNNRQVLELYMVTGGIPYYLNHVQKGLSAAENISKMAFSKQGVLYQDFDHLFESLFEDADQYREIISVISQFRYGIDQEELIKKCKTLVRGGTATRKIQDLEEAGFIISFVPYGHKRKGVYLKIIDEYTSFYLKWIASQKRSAARLDRGKNVWLSQRETPSWKAWSGYTFETVCLRHIAQIREALNIHTSATIASWRHHGKKTNDGAQIDLLFNRSDDSITICEIKYTEKPFAIDKSYYLALQKKIQIYQEVTKTKKKIFLAMIVSSNLKSNPYSELLVSKVVTLEDLFL